MMNCTHPSTPSSNRILGIYTRGGKKLDEADWQGSRSPQDYIQPPIKPEIVDTSSEQDGISCTVIVKSTNLAHLADYKHRLSRLDSTGLGDERRMSLLCSEGSDKQSEKWSSDLKKLVLNLLNDPFAPLPGHQPGTLKPSDVDNFSWFHTTLTARSIEHTFRLNDTDQIRAQEDKCLVSTLTDGTGKIGVFMGIVPCYQPSYADATARMPVYRLYGTDKAALESAGEGLKSWLGEKGWAVDKPAFDPSSSAKISQADADEKWEEHVGSYFELKGISTCPIQSRQLALLDGLEDLRESVTSQLPPAPQDGQSRDRTPRDPPLLTRDGVVFFRDVTDV